MALGEKLSSAFAASFEATRKTAGRFRLSDSASTYQNRRFGRGIPWILGIFVAEHVQGVARDINEWTNDEVIAWKNSYIAGCNAISVAGAIFASIGLTALQLPNIDSVHWSARALLTASMALGILSVVSATSQHHNIGLLNDGTALRLYLSLGKIPEENSNWARYPYPSPYNMFLLDSSIPAILLTQFPRLLLNVAVILYLVGFGLYLLFAWLEHVPDSSLEYRNIGATLLLALVLCIVYFWACRITRTTEERKVASDFDFQRLGDRIPNNEELKALGTSKGGSGTVHENMMLQAVGELTGEIRRLRGIMERRPLTIGN